MKAAEIYSELCQLRSSNGKYGKAPVQLEQEGVKKLMLKIMGRMLFRIPDMWEKIVA